MINILLNSSPVFSLNDQASGLKCQEFASFFKEKFDTIRPSIINTDSSSVWDLPVGEPPPMTFFSMTTDDEVGVTINKMK